MKLPKLIIFDMDGTLVDTLSTTIDALADAVEGAIENRPTSKEITSLFGLPEHQIIARLVGSSKSGETFSEYLKLASAYLKEVKLFTGIEELIKKIKKQPVEMAIFTGRSRPSTEMITENLKLNTLFSVIITADDVPRSKPYPDGIISICENFGISPKDTLMIGDSTVDMLAGKSAGASTVGCTWDLRSNKIQLLETGADHIIKKPKELWDVFKS